MNPKPNTFLETQVKLSRRQVRWQEFLSRFHFQWKFIPGARNIADPLSRRPIADDSTGTCSQHLGLSVLTRGAKAQVASQPPLCGADSWRCHWH